MLLSEHMGMNNKHVLGYHQFLSLLDLETKSPEAPACDKRKYNTTLTNVFLQLDCSVGNSDFLNDKIMTHYN